MHTYVSDSIIQQEFIPPHDCAVHQQQSQQQSHNRETTNVAVGFVKNASSDAQHGTRMLPQAPAPPPRQRTRSNTPPGEQNDHFKTRRQKLRAKKKPQEIYDEKKSLTILQGKGTVLGNPAAGVLSTPQSEREMELTSKWTVTSNNMVHTPPLALAIHASTARATETHEDHTDTLSKVRDIENTTQQQADVTPEGANGAMCPGQEGKEATWERATDDTKYEAAQEVAGHEQEQAEARKRRAEAKRQSFLAMQTETTHTDTGQDDEKSEANLDEFAHYRHQETEKVDSCSREQLNSAAATAPPMQDKSTRHDPAAKRPILLMNQMSLREFESKNLVSLAHSPKRSCRSSGESSSDGEKGQFLCVCVGTTLQHTATHCNTRHSKPAVQVQLVLGMEMSEIAGIEVQFQQDFLLDVAGSVSVHSAKMRVLALQAGSIIVTVGLAEGVCAHGRSAMDLANELVRQARDAASALRDGALRRVTHKTIGARIVTDVNFPEQPSQDSRATAQDSRGSSSSRAHETSGTRMPIGGKQEPTHQVQDTRAAFSATPGKIFERREKEMSVIEHTCDSISSPTLLDVSMMSSSGVSPKKGNPGRSPAKLLTVGSPSRPLRSQLIDVLDATIRNAHRDTPASAHDSEEIIVVQKDTAVDEERVLLEFDREITNMPHSSCKRSFSALSASKDFVSSVSMKITRTESLEDELRVREQLASHAVSTQDVAALCFALSFTKSHTATDTATDTATTAVGRASRHWLQETQLSPLHEAAAVGSLEMMALLLNSGNFTIDSRTTSGNTALHICIWEGHAQAADYLMSRGASSSVENCRGQRAFDFLSPHTLEPYSIQDLPSLINVAAAATLLKAENILGVRAQDGAKVHRERFRNLARLAKSGPDLTNGAAEARESMAGGSGRQKFLNSICAAYDIILHHRDIKYSASRASFRKSDEWAEVFVVLESKGLADILEWFLYHQLDGKTFVELSVDEMQELGLTSDRAIAIWKGVHGQPSRESLQEWLTEHGELSQLVALNERGVTTVQHLLTANLKDCIIKVGPRRRLEKLVQDQRTAIDEESERELLKLREEGSKLDSADACYIPSDAMPLQRLVGNMLREADTEKIMTQIVNTDVRDAMIDIADELVDNVRRESQMQIENRVRVQKLKLRVRELHMRADEADDRASCAAEEHEAALAQLEQQARAHIKLMAEKDDELLSWMAQTNQLKIEAISSRPNGNRAWQHYQGNTPADTPRSQREDNVSHILPDHENSFALSVSLPQSSSELNKLSNRTLARACVHKKHPRHAQQKECVHDLHTHAHSSTCVNSGDSSAQFYGIELENSPKNTENGPQIGQNDIDEKQAYVHKEAYRTIRLINKELQLQAVDLRGKVAEAKRDKTFENSAMTVLQQRISFLSKELALQTKAREQEAQGSRAQRDQLESLLNSVTRLVVNEERVDAMSQEVYHIKLVNADLQDCVHELERQRGGTHSRNEKLGKQVQPLGSRILTGKFDEQQESIQSEAAVQIAEYKNISLGDIFHPQGSAFNDENDFSTVRERCLEARQGQIEQDKIWVDVERLLLENEFLKLRRGACRIGETGQFEKHIESTGLERSGNCSTCIAREAEDARWRERQCDRKWDGDETIVLDLRKAVAQVQLELEGTREEMLAVKRRILIKSKQALDRERAEVLA